MITIQGSTTTINDTLTKLKVQKKNESIEAINVKVLC